MSDIIRSQINALLENINETETALNRQNIDIVDYHHILLHAKDQSTTVDDSSKDLQRVFQNLEADFRWGSPSVGLIICSLFIGRSST